MHYCLVYLASVISRPDVKEKEGKITYEPSIFKMTQTFRTTHFFKIKEIIINKSLMNITETICDIFNL